MLCLEIRLVIATDIRAKYSLDAIRRKESFNKNRSEYVVRERYELITPK